MARKVYIVGTLHNPEVVKIGAAIRAAGHSVFDDWHCAGPEADRYWQEYEQERGRSWVEALQAAAALHNFRFDLEWLNWADAVVLVLPAERDAHLEFGWVARAAKVSVIYAPEDPEKWSLMSLLATHIVRDVDGIVAALEEEDQCLTFR